MCTIIRSAAILSCELDRPTFYYRTILMLSDRWRTMIIYDTGMLRLQISKATMELTDIIPLKHEIQLHNCTRPVPSSQKTHYISIRKTGLMLG